MQNLTPLLSNFSIKSFLILSVFVIRSFNRIMDHNFQKFLELEWKVINIEIIFYQINYDYICTICLYDF